MKLINLEILLKNRIKIVSILFVLSVSFFLPLVRPPNSVNLLPEENKTIIINVFSPKLEFISSIDPNKGVRINVSYYSDQTQGIISILQNQPFSSTFELIIEGPGYVILSFFTSGSGEVIIRNSGLFPLYLVTILLLIGPGMVLIVVNRYISSNSLTNL